jgi:competence protein ComEA
MKTMQKNDTLWKKLLLAAVTLSVLALLPLVVPSPAHAAKPGKQAAAASKPEATDPGKSDDAPTGVVNINTASEDELMLLPGVGPSKAAAVIAWRKKYGAFKKVEDLTKVKGFGYKTLKKLKPYLSVSGPTNYRGKKSAAGDGPGGEAQP